MSDELTINERSNEILDTAFQTDEGNQKVIAFAAVTCRRCLEPKMTDSPQIAEYRALLKEYILDSIRLNVIPANMGAYAMLGITKDTKGNWKKGFYGQEKKEFAEDIDRLFSTIREMAAMNGKVNPVIYIFQAKSYDGLSDNPVSEDSKPNELGEGMTSKEIADKYGENIIIDD